MKRLNKQIVVWAMLTMLVLSAAAFPNELSFVAEAKAESSLNKEEQIRKTEPGAEVEIVENIKKDILGLSTLKEDMEAAKEAEKASLEAVQVPVVEAAESSEWDNKAFAKVEDQANIRESADAESTLLGRFRSGDVGEILETSGEWSKISSGSVTGYVKNEYIAVGQEAEDLANQKGKTATITTETLRVRKEPNEESGIVELASIGNQFPVTGDQDGWIGITTDSGETGFVKSEFVSVELKTSTAISIEEEQAAIKAAEEQAAKELQELEAKKQKAEAKKQNAESKKKSVSTTKREAASVSVDEETLLGALVQVEAGGESYEGKLAVASVVMNRVNSSRYPNSIEGVIYQSGQFPGAHNGVLARVLANGVKSSCMQAAREAIAGTNNIGSYMHFNMTHAVNTGRLNDYTIIGGQCFY